MSVELLHSPLGMANRELQLLDIAEPLVAFSFVDLRLKTLGDLVQPPRLRGVDLEEVAADTGVLVHAGRAVRAVAASQRDLALPEVLDELRPL